MAELEWQGEIQTGSLRRALRQALRRTSPDWRVVAEGFLAATSPIDLLAIGARGELIGLRAAASGPVDGARLLARALSDLAWLTPRVEDFHKLAPELGLRPLAPPCVALFAPDFDAEVLGAATHLSSLLGPDRLALTRYRALRQRGQLTLLLEPVGEHAPPTAAALPDDLPIAPPRPSSPLVDPSSPSAFRTGLTDADLRTEPLAPA